MDVQQPINTNKETETECPLCLDKVKNPKRLPCLHSFCLGCLDKRANQARRLRQHAIKCPVCQTSLQIPETDTFAYLPSPTIHVKRPVDAVALGEGTVQSQKCSSCEKYNPLTSYCLVCQSFVCASCFHSHHCFNATRGHRNDLINQPQNQDVKQLIERPVMCSQQYHEDQPLEFYCEDCKVLVCHKCSVVSHNRHSMTDLQKAAQEQKMQITEAVAKVEAEILVYENEIRKQTELKDKNITNNRNAEKKMIETVEGLIRDLREQEKKMKDRFRGFREAEQERHATRLENLEMINIQLKSFVERGQGILERNISAEILQTNPAIIGRCDELLNARKPDVYKSPHLNYLVDKKCCLLDQILVTKTDPSMCFMIEGHDSEIGKKSNFVVVTRDSEGLRGYQEDDQIKVDILTPKGDHLKTEWKDSKDGNYTVTYTPQCVGQHRVEIQLNGQPLTGSPLQVREHQYQFAFKFGSTGKRLGEFNWICDIAASDKSGKIAVADYWNKRIQLFSSDGKCQREVRLDGYPFSVVFTNCGNLLTLVHESRNKLHLWSEEGGFIKIINDEHLKKPQHLSITSDGRLIITDAAKNKVKVLCPYRNKLLLSFVAPDCDKHPDCAVYHQNKFYVSYPGAHCIKVFDKTGVYLHDIGCEGSNEGQFAYPLGLIIDKYNRLIVCDQNKRRLQLFTLSGKFLSKLQGEYFNNSNPWYCAINNDNYLFITDYNNNSVCVFH